MFYIVDILNDYDGGGSFEEFATREEAEVEYATLTDPKRRLQDSYCTYMIEGALLKTTDPIITPDLTNG